MKESEKSVSALIDERESVLMNFGELKIVEKRLFVTISANKVYEYFLANAS